MEEGRRGGGVTQKRRGQVYLISGGKKNTFLQGTKKGKEAQVTGLTSCCRDKGGGGRKGGMMKDKGR